MVAGYRCYSPELCRFIQAADVSKLNPHLINGLNLYSYANNNPISIVHNVICFGKTTNGRIDDSFGDSDCKTLNDVTISIGRLNLPELPWLVENATTIYGTLSSLVGGIPVATHYYKYASIINKEFRLYGISKLKTSLQLSDVCFSMEPLDFVMIGVNVVIDIYDSYQRGVSGEGILLGGLLTAVSGLGMLYLSKGIMWTTTTIGTAICPGLGTAIGFTVGLGISLFLDWQVGEWISNWIDSVAK